LVGGGIVRCATSAASHSYPGSPNQARANIAGTWLIFEGMGKRGLPMLYLLVAAALCKGRVDTAVRLRHAQTGS
jgi:hypothetical protein